MKISGTFTSTFSPGFLLLHKHTKNRYLLKLLTEMGKIQHKPLSGSAKCVHLIGSEAINFNQTMKPQKRA